MSATARPTWWCQLPPRVSLVSRRRPPRLAAPARAQSRPHAVSDRSRAVVRSRESAAGRAPSSDGGAPMPINGRSPLAIHRLQPAQTRSAPGAPPSMSTLRSRSAVKSRSIGCRATRTETTPHRFPPAAARRRWPAAAATIEAGRSTRRRTRRGGRRVKCRTTRDRSSAVWRCRDASRTAALAVRWCAREPAP